MVLAPMSGVTDEACRLMFLKYGKPDVFWTEFISAAALFSPKAKQYCLRVLRHSKKERPIVAQIFGSNPEQIEKAAEFVAKLGFDGVDINMGCPNKDIEKQGAGSALIKNPEIAKKVIRAAKKGAGKIPVSVKTRIGYNTNEIETWIPTILKENIATLTVHFRTKKEGYLPGAHWELAHRIVELKNKYSPKTLIIGNGDVKSYKEAKELAKRYKLDGVMVGRSALGNPWFFAGKEPSVSERLHVIAEHAEILEGLKDYNFDNIKKHFHAYCKNFVGSKKLKEKLMKVKTAKEAKKVVAEFK